MNSLELKLVELAELAIQDLEQLRHDWRKQLTAWLMESQMLRDLTTPSYPAAFSNLGRAMALVEGWLDGREADKARLVQWSLRLRSALAGEQL